MLKKLVGVMLALTFLVSLFSVITLANNGNGFVTNLEGWTTVSGDWVVTDNGYQARANAANVSWANTSIGAADFRYEADIVYNSGNQQYNLHFGKKDDQTKHWWVVIQNGENAATSNINVYGWDFNQGKAYRHLAWQPFPEDSDKNAFHIAVELRNKKDVKIFIDGKLVNSGSLQHEFEGGQFGLETYKTNAYFNNVNLTTSNFSTNITGWTGHVGTWTENLEGYQLISAGRKDNYAIADQYIPSGQAFIYEADVTLPEGDIPNNGCAVSLVYGITNKDNLMEGNRLVATLDMTNSFCRLFSFEKSTIKERIGSIFELTEDEKALRQFRIRMEMDKDGRMQMYLNGRQLGTGTSLIYEGGYVGLLAYNTDAIFNNVQLTIIEEPTTTTEPPTTTTESTTTTTTEPTTTTTTEPTTTTTTEPTTTTTTEPTTTTTTEPTTEPTRLEDVLKPFILKDLNNWSAERNPLGNTFKYSSKVIGKEAFIYEADIVNDDEGNRQYNMIFGIEDLNNVDTCQRYEVRIQLGESTGDANFSIYGYDTAQEKWVRQLPWKPLPSGSDRNAFHVKLVVDADGNAEVYVDGTLVTSGKLALGYNGGGFGLSTFKSAATFKNVQLAAASYKEEDGSKTPKTGVGSVATAISIIALFSAGTLMAISKKKRFK